MGVYEKWPGGTGICQRVLRPGVHLTAHAAVGAGSVAKQRSPPPVIALVEAALDLFLKCDCKDVSA